MSTFVESMSAFLIFSAALAVGACGLQVGFAEEMTEVGEHVRFPGSQVVLQAENDGQHSLVTVTIGDAGPYRLIVDTGSGPNVIDSEVAENLGLEVVGQREVLSGGVDPIMLDIVRVPHMRVGEMEIVNAEFLTAPLGQMSGGASHGVLGMELFASGLVTFDQQYERVILSGGSLTPDVPGVYALSDDTGPFTIEIDVADRMVPMHIDTGAPGGFTFPFTLAETLPLLGELREGATARLVGSERQTFLAQLDGNIIVGGITYENPPISFLNPSTTSGNIGNVVLGQFVVTVDQASNLLRLETAEQRQTTQRRAENSRRRIGVQFGGMGARDLSTVGGVVPGSLADQAGIRAADIIISLNGRSMDDYDRSDLRDLFGGQGILYFEVDRNGTRHSFQID